VNFTDDYKLAFIDNPSPDKYDLPKFDLVRPKKFVATITKSSFPRFDEPKAHKITPACTSYNPIESIEKQI